MRGDYVDVIYRSGVGTATHRVKAEAVGSGIYYELPRQNDVFIEVGTSDRRGKPLLKTQFSKNDVVALIVGHEAFKSRKRRKAAES